MERVVLRYLARLKIRNMRPRTIDEHTNVLRRFRRWVDGPILYLDHDDLLRWQTERIHQVQPATLRGEMSVLRSFYRWAVREELLDIDPTTRLDMPKVPRGLPRPLSDAKWVVLMEAADDVMRAILGLAGWAGLRAHEVANLTWENVDLTARTMFVTGKGGKQAFAVAPVELIEVLVRLPHRRGPVIPRRDGRPGPNLPATISHHANNFIHAHGFPDTYHSLRHAFGTNVLRATGNIRVTQEAMRHETPSSTAIYTQVDVAEIAGAVDAAARRLPAAEGPRRPRPPRHSRPEAG